MSTTLAPRHTPPAAAPKRTWGQRAVSAVRSARPALPPEPREAKATRLAIRRRLIGWSIVPVLVAVLIAVKLLVMSNAAREALDGWYALNAERVRSAADTMSFVNVVERHKAPFARGDYFVVAGDFDQARASFEEALALAPPTSVDSCQIRVNLALSLEKLGDAAKASGDGQAAGAYWQRVIDVRTATPPECDQPPADGAGQKGENAKKRAEQKLNPQQQQQGDQQTPEQKAQQDAKGDQLDTKTDQNQQQRAQQGPDGQQNPANGGSPSGPSVDKPW
ncbi:MAG TPA: hypothetical protein P5181_04045 [Dermatophilaceae bacterium]|nr:hypothetical protein [Dermatophilaceae bacterium]